MSSSCCYVFAEQETPPRLTRFLVISRRNDAEVPRLRYVRGFALEFQFRLQCRNAALGFILRQMRTERFQIERIMRELLEQGRLSGGHRAIRGGWFKGHDFMTSRAAFHGSAAGFRAKDFFKTSMF